jgi:hypothetical protein
MTSPRDEARHEASLAVWDLTSPVVVGRKATLNIGVACPSGCDLSGASIDVRDEAGAPVGKGTLGSTPWPDTTGLYWTHLEIAAPVGEGEHAWNVHATTLEPTHGHATSVVRFVACRPPDHGVTLEVIDKDSGLPLGGVELRVGRFRGTTNDVGIAHVEVPAGMYEVSGWKLGYDLISSTADVAGDVTIQLDVTRTSDPEQPYWM